MPSRRSPAQLDREILAALASPEEYRVAYLAPNPRRGEPGQETMLRLWYAGEAAPLTLTEAMAHLRRAKARGLTAWIADAAGRHVAVRGAARDPRPYSTAH